MPQDVFKVQDLREPTLSVPTETVRREMMAVTEWVFPGFVPLDRGRAWELCEQNKERFTGLGQGEKTCLIADIEALDEGDPHRLVWNLAQQLKTRFDKVPEEWGGLYEEAQLRLGLAREVMKNLADLGLQDSGLQWVVRGVGHELDNKMGFFKMRMARPGLWQGVCDTPDRVADEARRWLQEASESYVVALEQQAFGEENLLVKSDYRDHFSDLWERLGQGKMVIGVCSTPVMVEQIFDGMGMREIVSNVIMNAEKHSGLSYPIGLQVYTWMGIDERERFLMWVGNKGKAFPDEAYEGDDEYGQRVFSPDYTTGGGTGFGLSMVHRVVTEAGGIVEVMPVESWEIKMKSALRFEIPLK